MTTQGAAPIFEIPWPRAALRLKVLLGLVAFAILVMRAITLREIGLWPVFWFALTAAAGFLLAAFNAFRRLRCPKNPVVLDVSGLSVDDGLGHAWFLPWHQMERVMLRRGFVRRWVVIRTRDGEPELRLVHPALHYGLPPQWLAGMIETFRDRFTHGNPG
ncbi:MAG: hypothetical protein U0V87_01790 [Acidobacteriota bacterium]